MFIVDNQAVAFLLCVVTMLGWGSWANTQKLAGKERWPFALYYWDYAFGVALLGVVFCFTLGNFGSAGSSAVANLRLASSSSLLRALTSGAVFNLSNILLVIAIDAAGMSLAFPVGVGLALVIGTVASYFHAPKGSPVLLGAGVVLIVFAMIMSAMATRQVQKQRSVSASRGLLFAIAAGCLMGFFYPQLISSMSPNFNSEPIQLGYLTPYTALLLFGIGLLLSNVLINTVFMRVQGSTYREYREAKPKLHWLGLLGGAIWMIALSLNVIASGVAGPAVSYALGQGATLVAALWGVFVWKEFRGAATGTRTLVALMLIGYTAGLVLIGSAIM
ncbi:GRP family sugar transporter [Granulicella sp. S190]|uniref:GRP family sugar transporter n=1 Tax=Granulicella sp. S190 TaxID=1747226 RepID=UPI00131BFB8D|nr:GRP family sugar transporter [Granulicella sp. S190]